MSVEGRLRIAVCASHPVQYQAPLFRALAERADLTVLYAHRTRPEDQARSEFGVAFEWDLDLLAGYRSEFLVNVSRDPNPSRFGGCDVPDIGRVLGRGRFDALLVMGWHLKVFHQALFAAKLARLPVMVRGDSYLTSPRSPLKRLAKAAAYPPFLRLFDAVLPVGQRSREYFLRYRYPADRIFLAPHAVDQAWFAAKATAEAGRALRAERGISADERLLLFCGKLIPQKRPVDVIHAAAMLEARGAPVSVLLAGTGPLADAFRGAARERGVTVHDLGFCNQSLMPAVYAASDALVLPSANETWGLVVNEALASSRPVVLSDAVGSAPDLAADGTVGRMFPCGDVEAFAAAVEDLARRPPAPADFARKNRAFSQAAAVDGILAAAGSIRRLRREAGAAGDAAR